MNGFDLLVIAIVAASAILAFLRGIVKELLALASWVIGLIGALVFAGPVGDLLPEITASQHIETERDRLRRSAASAAAALASDYRTLGDHEQALVTAQRSIQLDPYQEIPWLLLADLHEKVGDVSSAEYVRREHARLRTELEVSVP